MTKLEHERLQGRLEGLREAEQIVAETKQQLITSTELRLAKRVAKLEVQLQAITPHDEVAELKARFKYLLDRFTDNLSDYDSVEDLSIDDILDEVIAVSKKALKSLEEK